MTSQLPPVGFEECHYSSIREAEMRTTEEESCPADTSDEYGSKYCRTSATDMDNERSTEPPDELGSGTELDGHDRFLVMPKRREEIKRLRATRVRFQYYEQLPVEIKLNVMVQLHPDDLLSLICTDRMTAELWSVRKLGIMRGMQEERFGDFAGVFDKFGSQGRRGTWELCENFEQAERSLRRADRAKVKEHRKMQKQLHKYGESSPWRQLALLGSMKEHLDEEVDAMYNRQLVISEATAKNARQGLLLLWQMRWELVGLRKNGEGPQRPIKYTVERLMSIFDQQPSNARSSAAEILSLVVLTVVRRVDFETAQGNFSSLYYRATTHQTLQPADLKLWIHGTMIAFVITFLLKYGVAQTLHLAMPSDPATILYDEDDLLYTFAEMLRKKKHQDQSGTSDGSFEFVQLAMGLAQGMELEIPRFLECGESFRRQLSVCGVL